MQAYSLTFYDAFFPPVWQVRRLVNREMLGAEVILYFDEQGKTLAVRLNPENQTQVGENVSLYFDMDKAHVFDPETEENLFYREEK